MDKYKIIRKLGQGPQSVSYLANPIDNPSEVVVLKRIASNVVRPSDVSVFLRLRHPCIVPCLAALQHEDQLVLVTPYYEGGDLEHYIELKKNAGSSTSSSGTAAANNNNKKSSSNTSNNTLSAGVDAQTVVKWTVQLVRALQYCHETKIIHRDLKLSNIFLSKDHSRVYLGGFGLARALDKTMSTATTLIGSPVNLSPEVISGQPYSFSSDVWSLGCLVYELLTFDKPFSSPSFAQVVMKVCSGQFDPLPSPSTPKFLINAVNGMLQVDVKQRWVLAEVVESDPQFLAADKQEKTHLISETPVRAKTKSKSREPERGGGGGGGSVTGSSAAAGAVDNNNKKRSASSSSNINNKQQQRTSSSSPGHSRNPSGRVSAVEDEDDDDDDDDPVVGKLSNAEELDQWIQWKHREFNQIDTILKKMKANENENATRDFDEMMRLEENGSAVGAAEKKRNGSVSPPPVQGKITNNNNIQNNAANHQSPRKQTNNNNYNHGLPLAPSNNNNNNQQAAAAGIPSNLPDHRNHGRRAINPAQHKQDKQSLLQQQQQQQQQKLQQQQLESAEKRQQQRAELQKRIAEGRRTHHNANNNNNQQQQDNGNNSANIVVATPSRALYNFEVVNKDNNNNHNAAAVVVPPSSKKPEPHTPPPRRISSSSNVNNNNNRPQQQTPPSSNDKGNNGNHQEGGRSSLKDEIARRRAEAKMSPRGGGGGAMKQPELEIVLPSNLKR